MKTFVVDASVAAKWFLPEPDSDRAQKFRAAGHHLVAPDLLLAELGSVMWKRTRRGELDSAQFLAAMKLIERIEVALVPGRDLLPHAATLAVRSERSFYDCLYLAAARLLGCILVTADARFLNSLAGTEFASLAVPLDELARG